MMNTIYVIVRHDLSDNTHNPTFWTTTEDKAVEIVKQLNENNSLNVALNNDGSMADICDDDAIWYDYKEVTQYED